MSRVYAIMQLYASGTWHLGIKEAVTSTSWIGRLAFELVWLVLATGNKSEDVLARTKPAIK
jgi:hypothetical protein